MSITLKYDTIRKIVQAVLLGDDHRSFAINMIDDMFVDDALRFLRKVVEVKENQGRIIDNDWYLGEFISADLDRSEIAWNAGLNLKTITNRRRGGRKEIVLQDSIEHYRDFVSLVDSIDHENEVNIDLELSFKGLTDNLNFTESIVVINALAVRRAAIRGGTWSSLGKQVEGPLMEVLCRLYDVPHTLYRRDAVDDDSIREVDFYLISSDGREARCEVKLMGKGNPESADAVVARGSNVFVASTLSPTGKQQLDEYGVHWTELQLPNGFVRFGRTLDALGIEHTLLHEEEDYTNLIQQTVRDYFE